jgi:hypothetical protein
MLEGVKSEAGSNQRANVPSLDVQMSWWAMSGMWDNKSTEEKFDLIAQAGFNGVFARLPQPDKYKEWNTYLERHSLSYGVQSFPTSAEDLRSIIQQAKSLGATYVNAQVQDYYMTDRQAVHLLNQLVDEAAAAHFPCFIETHRGTVTQDLLRTLDYLQAIPDLQLTIDLSHYVTAGELISQAHWDKATPYFEPLLQRTGSIHARISGGQQIQCALGGDRGQPLHPAVHYYVNWWTTGMRSWMANVQKDHAVLPVVCELGPPDYAITTFQNSHYEELTDRWQESLQLKELLANAWMSARS